MTDVITCTAEMIDPPRRLEDPDVPEHCQQWACRQPVETWCPLCRAYFCKTHDELYPRRMHDCLRGKAEA
jgi:hypothetical protein